MPHDSDVPTASFAVQRLRLIYVALGLTLLTFSQSSGYEAADTKLDLSVAPGRFLHSAFTLWDPTAAAGQLQDQAYGYLFPMGPFFLLGKYTGLDAWVVQRSWESLLLIAAFLGMVRLSRLLGVPGFWPRVAAGLTYALAPRMLMELGVISSELLPAVVLPWMLIPLVGGARRGSPRRSAARSGLAMLFASGINAAATIAILPAPALWLLTRNKGPRRRALTGWWLLAVALASLWWVIPLLVLGSYSPPFLAWIESSTVTTSGTNLVNALRGVDHWQAFLGPGEWPAGWILASAPAAIVATVAVAVLGVIGLARRGTAHRRFLVSLLVLGIALVTLGHVATVGPPFAGTVRNLLDATLNPFRNVHKFDPLIRLPIAVGLGHAVAAAARWLPVHTVTRVGRRRFAYHPRAVAALALIGIGAIAIAPALAGRVVPQTRTSNDPSWWAQTGSWLGQHEAAGGRALVVPGAAQPAYVWGEPRDDALQPVADGPWTVRDATPLTQPGYIRLLDIIESRIASGRRDSTLAPLLARSGIRYLVVRNDLDTGLSAATPLRFVHATISASPGFALAAQFGPDTSAPYDPNRLVDLGLTYAQGAVDVYEDTAWQHQVSLLPAAGTIVANGSSDELPQLVGARVSPQTPIVFGPEPNALRTAGVPVTHVLTDGIRRRDFGFGRVDSYSATLTAGQPYGNERAVHDYVPTNAGALTTAAYTGISSVTTSSAASAGSSGWAALDTDPGSAWVSNSYRAVGQWIQVELPNTVSVPSIQIAFAADQSTYPTQLKVTTDAGTVLDDVSPDSNTQSLALPSGRTRSIRLTVVAMSATTGPVALAALAIPGLLPSRTFVVPGDSTPDLISFSVLAGERDACLSVSNAPACEPTWAQPAEEDDALDRTMMISSPATYRADVTVRFRPGAALNNLLDARRPIQAIASSVDSTDPRERPGAAVDGRLDSGWVAKAGDPLPSVQLTLGSARVLSGLQLLPMANAPVAAPTRVLISVGRFSLVAPVGPDGVIRFPRRTASVVRIAILGATLRTDTDSATGRRRLLPVGIGEVRLLGEHLPSLQPRTRLRLGCGHGPTLLVDGTAIPTSLFAWVGTVLRDHAATAHPCGAGTVRLAAGLNRIRESGQGIFAPDSITLRRTDAVAAAVSVPGTVRVLGWTATTRTVRVATTGAAFLSVPENANAGWSASLRGHALPAVTLDGWHQGWLLPAHAVGIVELTFAPQELLDWGLILGSVAVLALVAGAVIGARRPVPPPVAEAPLRPALVLVGAAAGLAALGGLVGVLVMAVVLVGTRQWRRRWRSAVAARDPRLARVVAAGLPAVSLLLAAVLVALGPPGSARPLGDSAAAQVLCLVGIALLVAHLLPDPAPRAAVPAKQGPFEQVVGDRGSRRGAQRGEHEQGEKVPAEHVPRQLALDEDQQR